MSKGCFFIFVKDWKQIKRRRILHNTWKSYEIHISVSVNKIWLIHAHSFISSMDAFKRQNGVFAAQTVCSAKPKDFYMALSVNSLPSRAPEQNWPRRDRLSVVTLSHNTVKVEAITSCVISHDVWKPSGSLVRTLSFDSAALPNLFIFLQIPHSLATLHTLTSWPHLLLLREDN